SISAVSQAKRTRVVVSNCGLTLTMTDRAVRILQRRSHSIVATALPKISAFVQPRIVTLEVPALSEVERRLYMQQQPWISQSCLKLPTRSCAGRLGDDGY